jgi:CopG family transcriptional regulator / antitoxin EndoAI
MEKIIISLPEELLNEVNKIADMRNSNRSKVIREALAKYVYELKKSEEEALMAEGYRELARENKREADGYLRATNDIGE